MRSEFEGRNGEEEITHIAHESSVAPNPARAKLSGTSGTPPVFSVKDLLLTPRNCACAKTNQKNIAPRHQAGSV